MDEMTEPDSGEKSELRRQFSEDGDNLFLDAAWSGNGPIG